MLFYGLLCGCLAIQLANCDGVTPTASLPHITSPSTPTAHGIAPTRSLTPKQTSVYPTLPPTPKPALNCSLSSTCSSCTDHVKCIWCSTSKLCLPYHPTGVIPHGCSTKHSYWKQCTISGRILIIVIPSVVALILLVCGCCIYCKCCRKKKNYAKEDERVQRRKEERRQKEMQRKTERQQRTDEIRRKYGLLKDEDEEPLI